jgi:malate dehydrogenase (decarboxylating)
MRATADRDVSTTIVIMMIMMIIAVSVLLFLQFAAMNRLLSSYVVRGRRIPFEIVRRLKSDVPTFDYLRCDVSDCTSTKLRGMRVLHDPCLNKGTGHSLNERERLGLRGLLPPKISTLEEQMERNLQRFRDPSKSNIKLTVGNKDPSTTGITDDDLRKWQVLSDLQDRNETLFYKLLVDNFPEMSRIVYTPTVGYVCRYYHLIYKRPRGMFFSVEDRGQMSAMMHNWNEDVSAVVVTDGSRILGLGDLGANGLGISIGKLDLYVAAAGFSPRNVLPVVLDVGTNNEKLLQSRSYMGARHKRVVGDEFYSLVDEFMNAVSTRWPKAVIQFEDFSSDHAQILLDRYRYSGGPIFNDDIQGTACAATAGLLGALKVKGKPASAIVNERIVVCGTGSAGVGVSGMILKMLKRHGLSHSEATKRLFLFDIEGLVTKSRGDTVDKNVLEMAREPDEIARDKADLLSVIKAAEPTVLIGLTGSGGLFSDDVIRAMNDCNERPVFMPMSNPTSRLEATHEDVRRICGEKAIYMSGSPQQDVQIGSKTFVASQANNMYIFPGLAMGAYLAEGGIVSDEMLVAATESLPDMIKEDDSAVGHTYPRLDSIRDVSCHVAAAVIKQAHSENQIANAHCLRAVRKSDAELVKYIKSRMYEPNYDRPLVHV